VSQGREADSCTYRPSRFVGQLRMSNENDKAAEFPRLLGSRRFAKAFSELQKAPEANDVNRFLWSRRLFNAVQGLQSNLTPDARSSLSASTEEERVLAPSQSEAANAVGKIGLQPRSKLELEEKNVVKGQTVERPQLPELSEDDLELLARGERVQRQMRDGRVGTGMVVLDVEADIPLVFAVLADIDRYPERISTVREAITYQTGERLRKTQFQLSKFRLCVNTELRCRQEARMLEFSIDPQRPAPFLQDATGFWFLEDVSAGGQVRTRVWLVAGIACSRLLPTAIVDYAASKALPRATTWVKPTMEGLYRELQEEAGAGAGEVSVEQFVRERVQAR